MYGARFGWSKYERAGYVMFFICLFLCLKNKYLEERAKRNLKAIKEPVLTKEQNARIQAVLDEARRMEDAKVMERRKNLSAASTNNMSGEESVSDNSTPEEEMSFFDSMMSTGKSILSRIPTPLPTLYEKETFKKDFDSLDNPSIDEGARANSLLLSNLSREGVGEVNPFLDVWNDMAEKNIERNAFPEGAGFSDREKGRIRDFGKPEEKSEKSQDPIPDFQADLLRLERTADETKDYYTRVSDSGDLGAGTLSNVRTK